MRSFSSLSLASTACKIARLGARLLLGAGNGEFGVADLLGQVGKFVLRRGPRGCGLRQRFLGVGRLLLQVGGRAGRLLQVLQVRGQGLARPLGGGQRVGQLGLGLRRLPPHGCAASSQPTAARQASASVTGRDDDSRPRHPSMTRPLRRRVARDGLSSGASRHIAGAEAVRQAQNCRTPPKARVDRLQYWRKMRCGRRISARGSTLQASGRRIFHLSTSRRAVYCRRRSGFEEAQRDAARRRTHLQRVTETKSVCA